MTEKCNCANCGKVLHVPPRRFKNNINNFCSSVCYGKWCKGKSMNERRKKV